MILISKKNTGKLRILTVVKNEFNYLKTKSFERRYWYIIDELNYIYHHNDNLWRKIPLADYRTYLYKSITLVTNKFKQF